MREEIMRPGTAPARPVNEYHSEQVDLLVKEIFGSVAALASSTSGLSKLQRPHTACAGARAVATVIVEENEDTEDDDSDGASVDPDDDEDVFEESSRRMPNFKAPYSRTSGREGGSFASSCSRTTGYDGSHRPSSALTATAESTESSGYQSNAKLSVDYLSTLPRGEQRLLSGLCSRLSEASERAQATALRRGAESSCPSTPSRQTATPTLPASMADKLPRSRVLQPPQQTARSPAIRQHRVAGGLAPRASKFSSHNSWVNHLPIRKPVSITSALEKPEAPKEVAPSQETRQEARAVHAPAAPAVEPASPAEPASPSGKRRGPKYRVLPGGSRPALAPLAASASKTNQRELVVLEFRTEPRVVPASRKRFVRGEVSTDSSKKFPSSMLANKKSVGFTPHPRFRREDSGQWALEREALAKSK